MARKKNYKNVRYAGFFKKLALALSIVLGLGAIATCSYNLYDKLSVKEIKSAAYEVGGIDTSGKITDSVSSICLTDLIKADGLKCKLKDGAKIKYQVYFYDKNDKLLSSTEPLSVDFDGAACPIGTKSVRIMIIPTADEDGQITEYEKSGYADQLKIIINR